MWLPPLSGLWYNKIAILYCSRIVIQQRRKDQPGISRRVELTTSLAPMNAKQLWEFLWYPDVPLAKCPDLKRPLTTTLMTPRSLPGLNWVNLQYGCRDAADHCSFMRMFLHEKEGNVLERNEDLDGLFVSFDSKSDLNVRSDDLSSWVQAHPIHLVCIVSDRYTSCCPSKVS